MTHPTANPSVTINYVYMHVSPPSGLALQRDGVRLIWSAVPMDGCDMYVYQDAFNYMGPRPAPQVLMVHEPVSVLPGQYSHEVWRHFDGFLTTMDFLIERSPRFRKFHHHTYQWGSPPESIPTADELVERYPHGSRRHAVCMVLGNKKSRVPYELYSMRGEIARWFHENSKVPFDAYGTPPHDLPNYHGMLGQDEKLSTIAQYRFNICFENIYHPVWARGYVSDRIAHSFESRTVPIYHGCPNVADYIPPECFIDFGKFSGFGELSGFLEAMTDDEYDSYVSAIDTWLRGGGLHTYSCLQLYDAILRLYGELVGKSFDELVRADSSWEPAVLPEGVPTVSTIVNPVVHWSWVYLRDRPVEEAEAALAELERRPSVVGTSWQPETTTPSRARLPDVRVSRLLFAGPRFVAGDPQRGLDYAYANQFSAWRSYEGIQVLHFDAPETARVLGVGGMSAELRRAVEDFEPDVLFVVPVAAPLDALHDVVGDITRHTNTRTLAWMSDDPYAVNDYSAKWARCVDCLVTTSAAGLERYRELGLDANVVLSQWACHPPSYAPASSDLSIDCSLVAPHTHPRERIVAYLREQGIEVTTFGPGWEGSEDTPFGERLRVLGTTRVNLAMGGIRDVLEIAAVGGFVYTVPCEGLQECFHIDGPGKRRLAEVAVMDDSELAGRAKYYLHHDVERQAISRRCYERTMREHTWFRRYSDIFGRIGWQLPPEPVVAIRA